MMSRLANQMESEDCLLLVSVGDLDDWRRAGCGIHTGRLALGAAVTEARAAGLRRIVVALTPDASRSAGSYGRAGLDDGLLELRDLLRSSDVASGRSRVVATTAPDGVGAAIADLRRSRRNRPLPVVVPRELTRIEGACLPALSAESGAAGMATVVAAAFGSPAWPRLEWLVRRGSRIFVRGILGDRPETTAGAELCPVGRYLLSDALVARCARSAPDAVAARTLPDLLNDEIARGGTVIAREFSARTTHAARSTPVRDVVRRAAPSPAIRGPRPFTADFVF